MTGFDFRDDINRFLDRNGSTVIGRDNIPSSSNDINGVGGIFDPFAFFERYNEEARRAAEEQRAWSAEQAQKQMDFQERMANTQYQRAVEDMRAAGLNPYMLMSGAATAPSPTGAMATSGAREVYNVNDTLARDEMLLKSITSIITQFISSATGIAKSFIWSR